MRHDIKKCWLLLEGDLSFRSFSNRTDKAGAKALLYRGKKEIGMSLSEFIKRNSKGLFLYERLPEKEIEHTNNAAEIIFSLFKPQYKVMKEFQIPEGVQIHLNLFTLRHNFRVFPRGKRKGFSYPN